MKYLITIIIPTYNRANLLSRAIKSVLNQTFKDFELIVVDDGSTDNTAEVIKKFQEQDKRIRYIQHDKNKGTAATRNIGIKAAKGEYIAFLDSDDEWFPEKLEKQVSLFEHSLRKNLGFVSCNYLEFYSESGREVLYRVPRHKSSLKVLLESNTLCNSSNVMIKKEVFDNVGHFDEKIKIGEDWDMWIRIAQKYNFDFVEEPLFKYYIHQNNIMKTTSNLRKEKDIEYIFQKYKEYYKADPKLYSIRLRYEGTSYILVGEARKGRECFIKSIKKYPLNIKSYLYFLLSFGGKFFYYNLTQIKAKLKAYKIFNRI